VDATGECAARGWRMAIPGSLDETLHARTNTGLNGSGHLQEP